MNYEDRAREILAKQEITPVQLSTTLSELRRCTPCNEGWSKLRAYLGDDYGWRAPIHIQTILESNGLEDAVWAIRAAQNVTAEKVARLFCCDLAELVLPFAAEGEQTMLQNAIGVGRAFANGEASAEECYAAYAAVDKAARSRDFDTSYFVIHYALRATSPNSTPRSVWYALRYALGDIGLGNGFDLQPAIRILFEARLAK